MTTKSLVDKYFAASSPAAKPARRADPKAAAPVEASPAAFPDFANAEVVHQFSIQDEIYEHLKMGDVMRLTYEILMPEEDFRQKYASLREILRGRALIKALSDCFQVLPSKAETRLKMLGLLP